MRHILPHCVHYVVLQATQVPLVELSYPAPEQKDLIDCVPQLRSAHPKIGVFLRLSCLCTVYHIDLALLHKSPGHS